VGQPELAIDQLRLTSSPSSKSKANSAWHETLEFQSPIPLTLLRNSPIQVFEQDFVIHWHVDSHLGIRVAEHQFDNRPYCQFVFVSRSPADFSPAVIGRVIASAFLRAHGSADWQNPTIGFPLFPVISSRVIYEQCLKDFSDDKGSRFPRLRGTDC
jgi:hypothetical protein